MVLLLGYSPMVSCHTFDHSADVSDAWLEKNISLGMLGRIRP